MKFKMTFSDLFAFIFIFFFVSFSLALFIKEPLSSAQNSDLPQCTKSEEMNSGVVEEKWSEPKPGGLNLLFMEVPSSIQCMARVTEEVRKSRGWQNIFRCTTVSIRLNEMGEIYWLQKTSGRPWGLSKEEFLSEVYKGSNAFADAATQQLRTCF